MTTFRGFSLLEMLLVITLVALLAAVAAPLYFSFSDKNDLDTGTAIAAAGIRRAAGAARAVELDSQWGVAFATGTLIVFRGNSFAARVSGYDEPATLPASVGISGLTEVVFTKKYGLPNSSGAIVMTGRDGEKRVLMVSPVGVVTY